MCVLLNDDDDSSRVYNSRCFMCVWYFASVVVGGDVHVQHTNHDVRWLKDQGFF